MNSVEPELVMRLWLFFESFDQARGRDIVDTCHPDWSGKIVDALKRLVMVGIDCVRFP